MSVFVFFLKTDMPSADNCKSRKCGTSFCNNSADQNYLKDSIYDKFFALITNKVWSTYLA